MLTDLTGGLTRVKLAVFSGAPQPTAVIAVAAANLFRSVGWLAGWLLRPSGHRSAPQTRSTVLSAAISRRSVDGRSLSVPDVRTPSRRVEGGGRRRHLNSGHGCRISNDGQRPLLARGRQVALSVGRSVCKGQLPPRCRGALLPLHVWFRRGLKVY